MENKSMVLEKSYYPISQFSVVYMFGLSAKELILLHLEEHFEEQFDFSAQKIAEPPVAISQEGIEKATGLIQPQISRGIKSLEKGELIERKKIYVKATRRFREFYFLTRAGIHRANELKEALEQKVVKVKDTTGKIKEMKISDIVRAVTPRLEIRSGGSYLVKERVPKEIYDIFKYLTKKRPGICFTSTNPQNIKRKHEVDVPMFWVSDITGENILDPTRLDFEITNAISDFIKGNKEGVVLIDAFEYLVLKNGFERVLDFIKSTFDLISKHNAILIMHVNPESLSKKELTSLEGMAETLPERLELTRPPTHLEIIRYSVDGVFDWEKAIRREIVEKFIDFSEKEPRAENFFGRKNELKALSKLMDEQKKILAISGTKGIGKTAFVLRMLDEYKGKKHIFWYRCHEWDTTKTIISSLAGFLSKMNKKTLEQHIQSKGVGDLSDISSVLDSVFQDINALLVFEDAHKVKGDIVGLLSLLKELVSAKENITLIAVGRSIPKFYDDSDVKVRKIAAELVLTGLDPESSRKILDHKIDSSDFELVYKLTEGNPSLLEQIAGELKHQKDVKKYLREKIFSKMLMKGATN